MTKYILLTSDGERALDNGGAQLEFKRREEAYATAQDRAYECPGQEIEIYERIAVATVPTGHPVIKTDAAASIENIRESIAKGARLAPKKFKLKAARLQPKKESK